MSRANRRRRRDREAVQPTDAPGPEEFPINDDDDDSDSIAESDRPSSDDPGVETVPDEKKQVVSSDTNAVTQDTKDASAELVTLSKADLQAYIATAVGNAIGSFKGADMPSDNRPITDAHRKKALELCRAKYKAENYRFVPNEESGKDELKHETENFIRWRIEGDEVVADSPFAIMVGNKSQKGTFKQYVRRVLDDFQAWGSVVVSN